MSENENKKDVEGTPSNVNVNIDISDELAKKRGQEPEKPAPAIDVNVEREKIRQSEINRINTIRVYSEKYGLKDIGDQCIKEGKSIDEFREMMLDKMEGYEKVDSTSDRKIGMSDGEILQYSFLRAMRAAAEGNWNLAPFEKECSDAAEQKYRKSKRGSFIIPHDVLTRAMVHPDKLRDANVTTDAQGGYLVATNLLAASFIEMLRNKMVTRALGARVMSGLVGDVAIPKQTGGATAYWVTEGNAPTESQQTYAQVTMTPKTVGAFTDITRKLLIQGTPDAEMLVRQDLASVLALEIDRAAINGSGSGAEPTGILNTSGIGNVGTSPAAPTFADIVNLWKEVAVDNADMGAMGYVTTPSVCAKLMQTFTNSTYGEVPVWAGGPGDGRLIGFPAKVTNQMPSDLGSSSGATTGASVLHAILFGNWNDLIIGEWSGFDVLVDPYTASTTGTVRIVILMDCDVAIRHAESFAAMKEVDAG